MTFFKTILAAAFGFFVALALLTFFFFVSFGAALIGSSKETKIKSGSVLRVNLNYSMPDMTQSGIPFGMSPLSFNLSLANGLNEVIEGLDKAAKDKAIEGILLDLEFNPNSMAKLNELILALDRFKASGKFIVGYGQTMSQRAYYLGSAAEAVYLHPGGLLEFKGFNAETTFFTGALEKMGVEVQVFYDGKYKSATEPFRLKQMSEENRLQVRELIDELWGQYLDTLGRRRSMDREQLQHAANNLDGMFPALALQSGLVDGLMHEDELLDHLRERLGLDEEKEIPFVSLDQYLSKNVYTGKSKSSKSKNKVAVIYAEGDIGFGSSGPGRIGSEDLSKLLRKAREDKDIQAVVLKINSPGGVAPAGDMIWREAKLLAREKTLVVSMGDLAASAGYQIAAPADYIVAQPATLTGSIGVFMIIPNLRTLMEDKLGLSLDTVMTGTMADFPSLVRPVSEEQRALLQRFVDSAYHSFIQYVAEGRDMHPEQVEEIAQGRVWTGTQAYRLGLVDTLGTLQVAIDKAASLAGMGEDYELVLWPEVELSLFEQIMVDALSASSSQWQQSLKARWMAEHAAELAIVGASPMLSSSSQSANTHQAERPLDYLNRQYGKLLRWVQDGQVQARLPFEWNY